MHCYWKPHRRCRVLVLAALLPGCGGSDFGGEISMPPGQQHVLRSEQIDAAPLNLPADRAFNIHIKESQQCPGADGRAGASSDATADGQAFCQAEASNGGSASADFNIGHRIVNRTGSAQSVRIQLEYQLSQEIEASPVPTARTQGIAHMDLVVLDSHKRSIAKMAVVHATSDEATATVSSREQRVLAVQFEPGRSYDVMLFGKVDVATDTGQKAVARLEIAQLTMRLTFSPAETQPAAE